MIKGLGLAPITAAEVATKGYVDGHSMLALPVTQEVIMADGILTTAAGAALVSGVAGFHPCPLAAGSYDALLVNVATAQSGGTVVAKAAVYADDGTGNLPLTLGGPLAVVTLPALTSTGTKVTTFATPWACPGGLFWLAMSYVASAAPTTVPIMSCVSSVAYAIPMPASAFPARHKGRQRTGLTDMPTDASTVSNALSTSSNVIPVIGIRRA